MENIIALIPARSGSKTILGKNIQDLCGYPLIAYSIVAAILSKFISRIIVSTDSPEYAKISNRFGAETPFLRPIEISQDESTDREMLLHAIKWMQENENKIPDLIVHLRPTTPLRDPKVIDDAISSSLKRGDASSLRSGHLAPESPYKWFKKDKHGYFKSLMDFEVGQDIELYNQPKEMFEDIFIPSSYVDIVKPSHLLKNKNIHGEKMLGYKSPIGYEIDSPEELEFIEFLIAKKGSPLLDYLQKNHPH